MLNVAWRLCCFSLDRVQIADSLHRIPIGRNHLGSVGAPTLARLWQPTRVGDHLGQEWSWPRDETMRVRVMRLGRDDDERATGRRW